VVGACERSVTLMRTRSSRSSTVRVSSVRACSTALVTSSELEGLRGSVIRAGSGGRMERVIGSGICRRLRGRGTAPAGGGQAQDGDVVRQVAAVGLVDDVEQPGEPPLPPPPPPRPPRG